MEAINHIFNMKNTDKIELSLSTLCALQETVDEDIRNIAHLDFSGSFYHTQKSILARLKTFCEINLIQYYCDGVEIATITMCGTQYLIDVEINQVGLCVKCNVSIGEDGVKDEALDVFVDEILKSGNLKVFCDLIKKFDLIDKSDSVDKLNAFKRLVALEDVEMSI